MVPKNCPYAAPFALFRAPAESGRGIFFRFSFLYGFINSCIQTFREPYAALLPLQQNIHIHICRCHSDTRSLAWVLGRLPYIYICMMSLGYDSHIYIYIYISIFIMSGTSTAPYAPGAGRILGLQAREFTMCRYH